MTASTIAAARARLRVGRRVVCFSGAGLSAESGVPTFRGSALEGAGHGLWDRYDPMRLASPEGFAEDPALVLAWYRWRRGAVAAAEPNPAHSALAARPDVAQVTQNVDDLLQRAGARDVVQLHGTIGRDRCHASCGHDEPVDLADPPGARPCPRCGAPMRPSVVWFGEALPADALARAADLCGGCETLLVVGTSATVYPAAGLIDVARDSGADVIVVNTQRSGASAGATLELLGPAGEIVPRILAAEAPG